MTRKTTAWSFLIVGLSLSVAFILNIEFPQGLEPYFKREYYNQYGPLVVGIELVIASIYLLIAHQKTNFTLALFGFTALLDPIFDQIGLFDSTVPLYGTISLSTCALLCLWLAITNTYKLKPLSTLAILLGVVLGILTELFFNYI